jgi:hypothetical protein
MGSALMMGFAPAGALIGACIQQAIPAEGKSRACEQRLRI